MFYPVFLEHCIFDAQHIIFSFEMFTCVDEKVVKHLANHVVPPPFLHCFIEVINYLK
jgi:hypothetical protein